MKKNILNLVTAFLFAAGGILFFLSATLRTDPDTKIMFSITGTTMLIACVIFIAIYIAGKKQSNKPD